MDGSTGNSAEFTTQTNFNLIAGNTYVLSFWLSGNQRGATDTVIVSFGGATTSITKSGADPFEQFFLSVTPLVNGTSRIVFENQSNDNIGLILDSVMLEERIPTGGQEIPEPSTLVLLGAGLLGLGYLKRRK